MRLYHFTSPGAVPLIQAQGIEPSYLQVPGVGPSKHRVVSLTANPDPTSLLYKSLWDGSPLAGQALAGWLLSNPGVPAPPTSNTIAWRIQLEIDPTDERLFLLAFPDVQELGFTSQEHVDQFMQEGGGAPGEWCIFRGTIPEELIVTIDKL